VSITKHHIRLGHKMADKLSGDLVEVAYDKENNKLRIRNAEEDGMKMTNNKIGARGILNYFDISAVKGNFGAEFNPEDNAVYVDLNKRKS